MKILVLSGSPKGRYSITLQTVLYIESKFPQCDFEILHVGQQIRSLEKDMSKALHAIESADMLLFAYPVYTFIAPYQLHRFIELLHTARIDLTGKYAAQITTSKHFFDVTAHKYVQQNCYDLGLKYIAGLSADMDDLLTPGGREDAEKFWRYVLFRMERNLFETPPNLAPRQSAAVRTAVYKPKLACSEKKAGADTVIVTNCGAEDENLQNMTADFIAAFPYKTRVINIREYPFAGGCLGCFGCAASGKCVYKDGFDDFLRKEIQSAKAIVYAFTIKDHSMGASFKLYDDRQFCNGHRTVTMGMPIGYIVSGEYQNEPNLQMIVAGRCEVGHNFLAGVATDEDHTAEKLKGLADTLCYALENRLVLPQNFLGIGGMKIFRDLIYLMRGLMKADHKFYKKHGIYDFPQKKVGLILKMNLVGALLNMPSVKKKMGNRMNEGMIAPYTKAMKQAGGMKNTNN